MPDIDEAALDRAKQSGACYGHNTVSRRDLMEHMEECVVCGDSVRFDLTEHPLFGFEAGCEYHRQRTAT